MLGRWCVFLILFIFAISLTGCVTFSGKKDLQIQTLRNQISVLEAQLQAKGEEIGALKEELDRKSENKQIRLQIAPQKRIVPEVKSRPNLRQIQIALKNAGYNPGGIDGKMGPQTKEAIRAFQKANNLTVDGKVGKATWTLLKKYLYKKVK